MTMPKPLLPHHRRHYPPALYVVEWRRCPFTQKKAHAFKKNSDVSLCGVAKKEKTVPVTWYPPKDCANCRASIKRRQDAEKHVVTEHYHDIEFQKGAM